MSEDLESLRAEVAALRAELADQRDRSMSRRKLLTGLAGLGALGAAGVANAPSASADDNEALTLGVDNTSSSPTRLTHTTSDDETAFDVRTSSSVAIFATTNPEQAPLEGGVTRAILAIGSGDLEADGVANAIGAIADDGFALEGENDSEHWPTLSGFNNGLGPGLAAASKLHGPQLVLFREGLATAGPPAWAEDGALRFDANGDLWLCTATDPEPAWTRLLREDTAAGRTIPITPVRALDTRATNGRPPGSPVVPGQKKGPLKGGEAITLDLAGVSPIPAAASGVVGNLTVVSPSYSGYLMAGPSGTTPTTSALNFTAGSIVANAFTSQLGPDGLTIRASGTATKTYELVVDITAYIS